MISQRQFERGLLFQDVLIVLLSLAASQWLVAQLPGRIPGVRRLVPVGDVVHLLIVFVPIWAISAQRVGLQSVRKLTGARVDIARAVVVTQALGALGLAAILVAAQAPLNRSWIALFLTLSTALLLAAKGFQRQRALKLRGESVALVLPGLTAAREADLARLRGRRVEQLPLASVDALRERLKQGGVDEVVLPSLSRDLLRPLLEACEEVGVTALAEIEQAELELAKPRAEVVGRAVYLAYETQDLDRPERFVKDILDRVCAAFLLLLLSPLLLPIAIAILLDSRGPVLFSQWRGGLNGRRFRMHKFRTMREGAEAEREALLAANEMDGPVFKLSRDPRLTRLGGFLRQWSLDELPQLVNVLKGEMSLVGPRPLPVVESDDLVGWHRRRLSVRPGLTCLWQVSGRNDLGFEEWMALDLQYVDTWSLGLDLAILLRTLPAVLSRRGAR